MHAFISYSRANEALAKDIREQLHAWGHTTWMDVFDIAKGAYWPEAIDEGLKNVDAVIGIMTTESLKSRNVSNEWNWALSADKLLLLLRFEAIPIDQISHRFAGINYIDFTVQHELGLSALKATLANPPATTQYREGFGDLPVPKTHRSNEETHLLRRVKTNWIDNVLENSLYENIFIQSGMIVSPDDVLDPWDTVARHNTFGDYALPENTPITEVFEQMNRQMLILGEPGSGKTTTLLKIARDLLQYAEADASQPIPVVFPLSPWTKSFPSLEEWFIDELNKRYQIPRTAASRFIQDEKLILLLDGLDEVNEAYRADCVEAINHFLEQHGLIDIVICSRLLDYQVLQSKLKFLNAIILQPLTAAQIDSYLARFGDKLTALRTALTAESKLQEIAKTPLLLNIMILAYESDGVHPMTTPLSSDAWLTHMFDTYINRVLKPPFPYKREDTMKWLSWLAKKMTRFSQPVFYIDDIQPDWLEYPAHRNLVRFTAWGIYLMGAAVTLLIALAIGLEMAEVPFLLLGPELTIPTAVGIWLGVWIGSGLFVRRIMPEHIEIIVSQHWSPRRLLPTVTQGWGKGIIYGAAAGLIAGGIGVIPAVIGFFVLSLELIPVGLLAIGVGSTLYGILLSYVLSRGGDFGLIGSLIAGSIGGFCYALVGEIAGETLFAEVVPPEASLFATTLACGLAVGLGSGLTKSLTFALRQGLDVETRGGRQAIIMGSDIKQSARNARLFGLIFAVFGMVAGFLVTEVVTLATRLSGGQTIEVVFGVRLSWLVALGGGLIFFFTAVFVFGGLVVLQRFLSRLIFYIQGNIPWQYTRFLDAVAQRTILQKVGIGYRFMHDLLRQHITNSETP